MNFEKIKKHLQSYTVGIAGCGGLGSNCAVSLARSGIGKLVITDFDIVDNSNLNRQYYFMDQVGMKKTDALKANINRITNLTSVETHDVVLNAELIETIFKDCDIIVEAVDKAATKQEIIETCYFKFPHKPLITGLGMAGWGDTNILRSRQSGNLYICGDEISEVSDDNPPLAPRVSIVSNMQANIVLELILKNMVRR